MEREVFMERIYRGYPQVIWEQLAAQSLAGSETQQPYLLYNRDAQPGMPVPMDERRRIQAEYEYFRGMYPLAVRRWQRFVDMEVDANDVPGGAIYDEFPDREMIFRMRDRILRNAAAHGFVENQDLVMVLVLNEILRRRALRR